LILKKSARRRGKAPKGASTGCRTGSGKAARRRRHSTLRWLVVNVGKYPRGPGWDPSRPDVILWRERGRSCRRSRETWLRNRQPLRALRTAGHRGVGGGWGVALFGHRDLDAVVPLLHGAYSCARAVLSELCETARKSKSLRPKPKRCPTDRAVANVGPSPWMSPAA
jgi:hypothetical protein